MAKRTDSNQTEIVKLFRNLGCTVQILSDVGRGCPDLVIGMQGKNFLVEVKDGKKCLSAQKLTEHEQKFFDTWKGQVCIISSQDDLLRFIESHTM